MDEGVGSGRGHADCDIVAQPLVSDRSESVDVDECVARREGVTLLRGRRAARGVRRVRDRHRAGHGVVDVHDCVGLGARDGFDRVEGIGLGALHRDLLPDVGLDEGVGGAGRVADCDRVAHPLVGNRPDSIDVGEGVARREGVTLLRGRRAARGV